MNWKQLNELSQVDEIITNSTSKPIVIFKHSTRCGISAYALSNFESEWDLDGKIDPYYLDLIKHRDISNHIAERFKVVHQSPQVILIKDGKSIYEESHHSINTSILHQYL